MNNKSGMRAPLMMALAMMGCAFESPGSGGREYEPNVDIKGMEEKRKNLLVAKKGVQEFTIEGITVLARNLKNAKRKVENIKKQQSI